VERLKGLLPAAFTPMDAEGHVRVEPIPALVERLIDDGIAGLYVCGSTGEGPSLSMSERKCVAKAYVDAAAGRVPVIVQVGHNSLEEARDLAAHAASVGADAISATPPAYFKPRDLQALATCIKHIADAAPGTPFYYYHIPVITGVSADVPQLLLQASESMPTLAGVKFSDRDLDMMQRCLALEGGRFDVVFGVDEMLLGALVMGCEGAVGSTYNLMTPLYRDIMRFFDSGNHAEARTRQLRAAEVIQVLLGYHGISGIKAAMSLKGHECGPTRLPLQPLTEQEFAQMRDELAGLGFFAEAVIGSA